MSDEDQRVATYEYDGLFRRCEKTVANQGIGVVNKSDVGGITGIEAGDRHERYYYSGWRLVEVRNASDQTLGQFVYGTQYIDEPLRYDRNTDVGTDDDCLDEGSAAYFYHQDANYRVVMLTDENADVVERYEYTAYGEPTILGGYSSSAAAELGNALLVSTVGNPLMHQGLWRDGEIGSYQNRFRQYAAGLGRFSRRDSLRVARAVSYEAQGSRPFRFVDPLGLQEQSPAWVDFNELVTLVVWNVLEEGAEEQEKTGLETGGIVFVEPEQKGLKARRQITKKDDGTENRDNNNVDNDLTTNEDEKLVGTWHTHPNMKGKDMPSVQDIWGWLRVMAQAQGRRAADNLRFYIRVGNTVLVMRIIDAKKAQRCLGLGYDALEKKFWECVAPCLKNEGYAAPDCQPAHPRPLHPKEDKCFRKCTRTLLDECGMKTGEGRKPHP